MKTAFVLTVESVDPKSGNCGEYRFDVFFGEEEAIREFDDENIEYMYNTQKRTCRSLPEGYFFQKQLIKVDIEDEDAEDALLGGGYLPEDYEEIAYEEYGEEEYQAHIDEIEKLRDGR